MGQRQRRASHSPHGDKSAQAEGLRLSPSHPADAKHHPLRKAEPLRGCSLARTALPRAPPISCAVQFLPAPAAGRAAPALAALQAAALLITHLPYKRLRDTQCWEVSRGYIQPDPCCSHHLSWMDRPEGQKKGLEGAAQPLRGPTCPRRVTPPAQLCFYSSRQTTGSVPQQSRCGGTEAAPDGASAATSRLPSRNSADPRSPSCPRRWRQQKFRLSALVPFSAVITFYG